MKLFDSNMKVLEKGLDAYSKRAEALANNIANVNTPNYKRKDIQFESFLEKALRDDGSSIIGKRTDEKHFQIGRENKLDGVEANFIEENSTVTRFDGNNVDIEKEKAIDLAAFEKLTNEKDLYSIHRPNSRKNVRIIYTIIDRKIIILLTVFLEKNKSDYQNAISVAKNRLKQLQE